jgi:hypothetical protein
LAVVQIHHEEIVFVCLKRYLKEKVNPKAELKINEHNFFVVDLHDGQGNPLLPCETIVTTPLYTEDN